MSTNPNTNPGAGNNDPGNEEIKTTIPGGFDLLVAPADDR
jgi:hypothetical protein